MDDILFYGTVALCIQTIWMIGTVVLLIENKPRKMAILWPMYLCKCLFRKMNSLLDSLDDV